jgi:hypothetical protein
VGARLRVGIASATTWEPLELDAPSAGCATAEANVRAGMGVAFDALSPPQALALHRLFCAHGFEDE